jgi:hypothetical protein
MSTSRHSAPRRYDAAAPPLAVVILAVFLFLAAFFIPSGHAAGPETFAPAPQVTVVQPSPVPSVTSLPDKAALHREHVDHLAHLERLEVLHAAHVKHLHHLAAL